MVRADRRLKGSDAEQRAYRFLKRQRLQLVTRNFRCRRGEIDLIMLDGDCLVFAEVRCRSVTSFVDAAFTVDERKQQKLCRTAATFLASHQRFRNHACRFDVIGIDHDTEGRDSVQWIRDAFRPES